jgi:hypothetical protein
MRCIVSYEEERGATCQSVQNQSNARIYIFSQAFIYRWKQGDYKHASYKWIVHRTIEQPSVYKLIDKLNTFYTSL